MISFDKCRISSIKRDTFFSALKDAAVHLTVRGYKDGTKAGKVTSDGVTLYFGSNAEGFFNEIVSKEEAHYAILRAQIRASTGFDPREL